MAVHDQLQTTMWEIRLLQKPQEVEFQEVTLKKSIRKKWCRQLKKMNSIV